ncbi:MAG: hypothetical protein FJW27_11290 [Acidimicrobiia bacterium]|nr:hypothetical protein [Acidimicrobiia bacterium]
MIAFLSQRSLLSIDLYVAETATGNILKRLTSTATSPHFSSLQFIYSAGAWDPASRRIALATVTEGRAILSVFDARSGRREREVALSDVDEIFNPTWAPDGRSIAFTGMARGLTDLYALDLDTGNTRALTRDPCADLQPAWAPDGRRIAFVTDRFSSRLDVLEIGTYRVALIDPTSGQIKQSRPFTSGKSINPQWAPDSRALYFISDRDGISNLYRVTLDAEIAQLTTVATGLTGITAQSPALSVATKAGVAAFSVYDKGAYVIRTFDPVGRGGRPGDVRGPGRATLPPEDRKASDVAGLLSDPSFGLPALEAYETAKYRSGLRLDAIGQPTIAFGPIDSVPPSAAGCRSTSATCSAMTAWQRR